MIDISPVVRRGGNAKRT